MDPGWPFRTLCGDTVGRPHRNHFQVIAETGQLQYDGKANGGHLFRPVDKDKLDFSEPAMPFYAQESTTWMTQNTTIAFHCIPAIHVSSHLYVAYSELRSPGFAQSLGFLMRYRSSRLSFCNTETDTLCLAQKRLPYFIL